MQKSREKQKKGEAEKQRSRKAGKRRKAEKQASREKRRSKEAWEKLKSREAPEIQNKITKRENKIPPKK